jgi:hypothetical protein
MVRSSIDISVPLYSYAWPCMYTIPTLIVVGNSYRVTLLHMQLNIHRGMRLSLTIAMLANNVNECEVHSVTYLPNQH